MVDIPTASPCCRSSLPLPCTHTLAQRKEINTFCLCQVSHGCSQHLRKLSRREELCIWQIVSEGSGLLLLEFELENIMVGLCVCVCLHVCVCMGTHVHMHMQFSSQDTQEEGRGRD